jgi:hypothetical protein
MDGIRKDSDDMSRLKGFYHKGNAGGLSRQRGLANHAVSRRSSHKTSPVPYHFTAHWTRLQIGLTAWRISLFDGS